MNLFTCSIVTVPMRKMIFGLLLSAISVTGFARQGGIQRFDDRMLEQLQETRTPAQSAFFKTISDANNYVNVGIPAGLFVTGLIRGDKDMQQNALYVASSAVTTELFNMLVKKLVKRPRPFVTNLRLQPMAHPSSYSFPSGHTSSAFSTATSLSHAYPKWYVIAPSMLWAASVGYSRMYLGVHYPTDVGVGMLQGAGTAFAMGWIRP
ncbi:MAG: phosphatase PAP2 family protein [Candidatus Pseudobacter hemicellulosilyticus]|uniref:Phosphatase PAP2 family protein n=1 Tax=Candidatus Pseudobacter hemicellulosilyticus TaxID=3121375 RepID=A0AAJ5WTF8_9BACT|nr:MAG: phosphatase PAP2 family protein [Pseudobacter sp.]